MKKLLVFIFIGSCLTATAQTEFNNVFAAGVNDAEQFTSDYMAPLSESVVYSLATGWYNTADAKPLGGFEISIIGNITDFKNFNNSCRLKFESSDISNSVTSLVFVSRNEQRK